MYEHLKSQTLPELTATLKELGLPAFRGKQVYTWLHKGVRSLRTRCPDTSPNSTL